MKTLEKSQKKQREQKTDNKIQITEEMSRFLIARIEKYAAEKKISTDDAAEIFLAGGVNTAERIWGIKL